RVVAAVNVSTHVSRTPLADLRTHVLPELLICADSISRDVVNDAIPDSSAPATLHEPVERPLTGTRAVRPTSRDFVLSFYRGLTLICAFVMGHPRLTLDDASLVSGISRSATWRLLRTLEYCGYVSFDGHHYSLTPRLLDLGYVQQSQLTLPDIARPHCDELARTLHLPVAMATLDGHDIVF